MTLIERYVGEVARRLPPRQRADVARELESSLLDALDSRFGPQPSEENVASLLKELGPPETVAASYHPSSQYLIGPGWYPTFLLVLRIHLVSLLAVLAVGALVFVLTPARFTPGGLWDLIGGVLRYGLIGLGVITLVFYLLERGGVQSPRPGKDWDPHDLPIVNDKDRVGRAEATLMVVLTALALVVLHQFTPYIGIWWGGEAPPLLNNVVRANVPWLSGVWVLTMALYAVLAWQGHWRWYTRSAELTIDLVFLYVAYRVASGVIAEQDTLLAAGLPPVVVTVIARTAVVTVPLMAAGMLFKAARLGVRAWRGPARTPSLDRTISADGGSR